VGRAIEASISIVQGEENEDGNYGDCCKDQEKWLSPIESPHQGSLLAYLFGHVKIKTLFYNRNILFLAFQACEPISLGLGLNFNPTNQFQTSKRKERQRKGYVRKHALLSDSLAVGKKP